VEVWTGAEAAALRQAMRMSVRAFAAKLGIAPRTVSYWEARGAAVTPLPGSQEILDVAHASADATVRQRFANLTNAPAHPSLDRGARPNSAGLSDWAEDLERAREAIARQHFDLAGRLTDRWLTTAPPTGEHADELRALTLLAAGDLRRDQGQVVGPGSAQQHYRAAGELFAALGLARRWAQTELALGVVAEMSGVLDRAAAGYDRLSTDERLSQRDRARALLWTGTALTKQGLHTEAAERMASAVIAFDDLGEVEDWAVAHQKLALVHRATGLLDQAHAALSAAAATGTTATPLQQARLWTARGHVLLSDRATAAEGEAVLSEALALTARYGLGHQRRSIDAIRAQARRGASL
jgi:transcriptional regulator with XRE-family HTH domain